MKPASAAPGPAETRTAAQAKTLLIKATAALEAQDHPLAASHLRRYLQVYPDAVLIRMQLAELYYQLSRFSDAEEQFRSALGEVIDPALPLHCRLHGHSRLMELAQERTDTFNEELHRGIGLVLLAEHRQNQKPSGQMVNSAQLLGKARTALVKAGEVSPKDARPALYLTSVWHSMPVCQCESIAGESTVAFSPQPAECPGIYGFGLVGAGVEVGYLTRKALARDASRHGVRQYPSLSNESCLCAVFPCVPRRAGKQKASLRGRRSRQRCKLVAPKARQYGITSADATEESPAAERESSASVFQTFRSFDVFVVDAVHLELGAILGGGPFVAELAIRN